MWVCVCVCVWMCLCMFVCLCVTVSVMCVCLCICICVCMCVCRTMCVCVCLLHTITKLYVLYECVKSAIPVCGCFMAGSFASAKPASSEPFHFTRVSRHTAVSGTSSPLASGPVAKSPGLSVEPFLSQIYCQQALCKQTSLPLPAFWELTLDSLNVLQTPSASLWPLPPQRSYLPEVTKLLSQKRKKKLLFLPPILENYL